MPNIFKRFVNVAADKYIFPDADELTVAEPEPEPEPEPPSQEEEPEEPESEPEPTAIDFAQIQADAILAQAEEEARLLKEKAIADAQAEVETMRSNAREEGYRMGYAQGVGEGRAEGRKELDQKAVIQEKEIQLFMREAMRARDQMLEDSKQELKELALTIAEKVIRVSLKSSGDILIRMIESATAKRRRCEWVQIYIADCDAKASAATVPELAEAMSRLSDRVRIIPMADDESGTCIIEMPDEILDVSVSTQLDNLRGIISNADTDRNPSGWPG